MDPKKATFAAGCFWHVQKVFSETPGVLKTSAGYTGGKVSNPTYERVCSGDTDHLEAVELEYDPEKIEYDELLELFFELHDPTTKDRQGPDVGRQYASAIFYHDEFQRNEAEWYKQRLIDKGVPVVTEIRPVQDFYPAEEYHQNYLKKKGGTCGI